VQQSYFNFIVRFLAACVRTFSEVLIRQVIYLHMWRDACTCSGMWPTAAETPPVAWYG